MAEYVVRPGGRGFYSLAAANKEAKNMSKREGDAEVENRDTNRVVSRYENGRKVKHNSARSGTMKRPKLGKWVSAAKVRLTKKNGVTVVELRRVVKKNKKRKKR